MLASIASITAGDRNSIVRLDGIRINLLANRDDKRCTA